MPVYSAACLSHACIVLLHVQAKTVSTPRGTHPGAVLASVSCRLVCCLALVHTFMPWPPVWCASLWLSMSMLPASSVTSAALVCYPPSAVHARVSWCCRWLVMMLISMHVHLHSCCDPVAHGNVAMWQLSMVFAYECAFGRVSEQQSKLLGCPCCCSQPDAAVLGFVHSHWRVVVGLYLLSSVTSTGRVP